MFTRSAHRLFPAISFAFLAAPALVRAQASESVPSPIRVGPNVHVSVARSATAHYEVLVAADPTDPNRLLACSIMARRPEFSGTYLSTDGGQQWRPAVATDSGIIRGDPDCAIGRDEKAYFIQMSNYPDDGIGPVRPGSFYSHDGGTTWRPGVVPMASGATTDRPYVVVDNGAKSPYRGRVYLYNAHTCTARRRCERAVPPSVDRQSHGRESDMDGDGRRTGTRGEQRVAGPRPAHGRLFPGSARAYGSDL